VYIDDFTALIVVGAIVVGLVFIFRLNGRIGLLEREIGALRSFVLSTPAVASPAPVQQPAAEARPEPQAPPAEIVLPAAVDEVAPIQPAQEPPTPQETPKPEALAAQAFDEPPPSFEVPQQRKPDIETALGTRWAVWVGGLALALGGIFLVRYSIEAGIFGPGARLTLAALFGVALFAAGEFIRRTGYKVPLEGLPGAYIPAILTAAGSFTLFGTIYAAHALYGFLGPTSTFLLLGIVALATLLLSLIHGQALAGVGMLGALLTPLLVSSEAPNAWALFGYLAIVLAATYAVARVRVWTWLPTAASVGTGLWLLVYLAAAGAVDVWVIGFISAVQLACLAVIWLGRIGPWSDDRVVTRIFPAIAPAFFVGLPAFGMVIDPALNTASGVYIGTALIVAMVAIAAWRLAALPLLFGAAAAAIFCYGRFLFFTSIDVEMRGGGLTIDSAGAYGPHPFTIVIAVLLSALFLAGGALKGRELASQRPVVASFWTVFAAIVPNFILLCLWFGIGDIDRDLSKALAALVLTVLLLGVAELVARAETPPHAGRLANIFAVAGAGAAWLLFLHMAFGPALTTILLGASAAVAAFATRYRPWPALGGLSVAAAIATLARLATDPTVVGPMELSTTPFFNVLLPGYGIPTLAFAFAAWQLRRTTDGRARLAMEAAAALFALLTLAILVRHAMNGGVISDTAPTLAEQAIYSLMALGAGGILIALDLRSPSPVFRYGSMAAGMFSVIAIVTQHFGVLNPLFTDESTGRIPVFNLLFLAYLLPALAAGALAWYARGKRPAWYSAMLACLGALLAFAYATLQVRRLFQGEHIALWSGLGQVETYAYSALWLAMGVGLLVVGVRAASNVLRLASAALIVLAVAKVFLFDMSELQGVLRALSFIGLGAVLIGIGLFYQRLLTRAAAAK